jgi:hypothetical protein
VWKVRAAADLVGGQLGPARSSPRRPPTLATAIGSAARGDPMGGTSWVPAGGSSRASAP